MAMTAEQTRQFTDGVRQGAEDAASKPQSDLSALQGDPHFADGYTKGYALVSGERHGEE